MVMRQWLIPIRGIKQIINLDGIVNLYGKKKRENYQRTSCFLIYGSNNFSKQKRRSQPKQGIKKTEHNSGGKTGFQ